MQGFASGDAALDLASLNGEDFEKLVEALFHAKEVRIGEQIGRGPDQGRDLLITTIVNDGIVSRMDISWFAARFRYKSAESFREPDRSK